jgi:filamentous hemagglutinin
MNKSIKIFLIALLIGLGLGAAYLTKALPCVVAGGCTGQSNIPLGSTVYGSSTNQSLNVLPIGASGTVLTVLNNVPGWASSTGSGGGTPGGSSGQVQYNNSSAFGGISAFTWNGSVLQNTATTSLSTTTIAQLSVPNLEATLYADQFSGSDIGAKVNAAYAALPSTGGTVVVPAGSYTYNTPILWNTASKPANLLCSPGATNLSYTGTGNAVTLNTSIATTNPPGFVNGYGMDGCTLIGTSAASSTVGLYVGGNNAMEGVLIQRNNIRKFGVALETGDNVWVAKFWNNNLGNSGQSLVIASNTNSGENITFEGNTFYDNTLPTNCIDGTLSYTSVHYIANSFDDCQVVIGVNTYMATFVGNHWENPAASGLPNYASYTPLSILTSANTSVTMEGDTFIDDANSATSSPAQLISNGGNLTLTGISALKNGSASAITNLVLNTSAANLNLNGFNNTNGAVTNIVNGTGNPSSDKLDVVNKPTGGDSAIITNVQSSPNTGDTSDGSLQASYNLTANSASNELVTRSLYVLQTNNLTGGGHIQNARNLDISTNENSGTVTDSNADIYLENAGTGTTTTGYGLQIVNIPGITKWGVWDNSGANEYFGAKVGIGTTTPLYSLDVYPQANINPFNVSSSSNGSLFNIQGNGNIGIGTTVPNSLLTIQGTTSTASLLNIASSSGASLLFIANTGNIGMGSSNPGNPLTLTKGGQLSGATQLITTTQTAPNTGDTQDGGLQVSYNLSTSSATNELVTRALFLKNTNNLTGGGHSQNARVFDLDTVENANTVTDSSADVYLEDSSTGTTTTGYGVEVVSIPGLTKYGFYDQQAGSIDYFGSKVGIASSSPAGVLGTNGTVFMAGLTTAASSAESGYLCLNGQNQVINDSSPCLSVNSGTISTSTNAIIGHEANWTASNTLGNGAWLDNGTVVGFNATSSTIGVNIQGTAGTNTIFNVASSSSLSDFNVLANGNVGIGSSTPTANLVVQGTSTQTTLFIIASSTGSSLITMGTSGTNGQQLSVNSSTTVNSVVFIGGSTNNPTYPLFTVASSSGVSYLQIDQYGHKITGGASPTCGAGCTSVTGDDETFRAITGTGVTSVTVNFAHAYSETPVCIASDESGGTTVSDASSTPSSVTMNLSASLTTKSLAVICQISSNFTN